MGLRERFAERFGEDQAAKVMAAAIEHDNDVHNRRGSDEFRWALAITIGYECWSVGGYRKYHGITAPADEVRQWIKDEADLGSHDGDVDFVAAFAGVYNEYIGGAS